jgi:hypothetical protein
LPWVVGNGEFIFVDDVVAVVPAVPSGIEELLVDGSAPCDVVLVLDIVTYS